jgi:hypothetical protein
MVNLFTKSAQSRYFFQARDGFNNEVVDKLYTHEPGDDPFVMNLCRHWHGLYLRVLAQLSSRLHLVASKWASEAGSWNIDRAKAVIMIAPSIFDFRC